MEQPTQQSRRPGEVSGRYCFSWGNQFYERWRDGRPVTLGDCVEACYGVGAATGPMIMTAVMHAGDPWQRGYVIVGAAQLGLAVAFAITAGWWPTTAGASPSADDALSSPMRTTLPAKSRLALSSSASRVGVPALLM